jgi:hypothetical protein
MLLRNIIEIIVLSLLICTIGVIYVYAKKRVSDIESDISIMHKSDLIGKFERIDEIEEK